MNSNKFFCFIATLIILSTGLKGQTQFDRGIQSPNASALGKYGANDINIGKGSPNIQVPIINLSSNGLTVPVSLQNSSSGFKPSEIPSWVGHGWSLNAGGVITRTVRGVYDEKQDYGLLTTGGDLYDSTKVNWANKDFHQLYFEDIVEGEKDGEPDLFFFNFNGYSGSFIFLVDEDDNIHIKQLTDAPLKFSYTNYLNELTKFTITTPDGTKYIFDETEETNSISLVESGNNGTTFSPSEEYNSSWYLSSITTINGISAHFTYNDYSGVAHDRIDFQERITGNGTVLTRISTSDEHDFKLLSSISIGDQSLSFSSSTRSDFSGERKLDSMTYQINGQTSKIFNLDYSYLDTNKRLKLDSVTVSDGLSNDIQSWAFEYYTGSGSIPDIDSEAIDLLGYFNGITSNDGGSVLPEITDLAGNVLHPGDNNTPNMNYAKWGMLKKIIYPSGGSSLYEYEANDTQINNNSGTYYYPKSVYTALDNSTNTYYNLQHFFVGGGTSTVLVSTEGVGIYLGSAGGPCTDSRIKIYNDESLSSFSYVADVTNGSSTITLNTQQDYWIETTRTNNGVDECAIYSELLWTEETTISPSENITEAPGLRVKRITTSDGVSTNNDIIKEYSYRLKSDSLWSSGYLPNIPSHHTIFEAPGLFNIHFHSSTALSPLGEAGLVNYSNVKEEINGANNSGYTWYHFDQSSDSPPLPFQIGPHTSYSHTRGNLILKEHFDKDDNKISKEKYQNQYEYTYYNNEPGTKYRGVKFRNLGAVTLGDNQNGWVDISVHVAAAYEINQVWKYNRYVKNTFYDLVTGDSTETITWNFYQDKDHKQLTRSERYNSDGTEVITRYVYASEIYAGMESANMLVQPFSVEIVNPNVATSDSLLNKTWTRWRDWGSGVWRPCETLIWDGVSSGSISSTCSVDE